ncbi:MAG: hypothetical protein AAGB22_07065 [Bacteroidota bacterium]
MAIRLPSISRNLFDDFSIDDKLFFLNDHGLLKAQIIYYDLPIKLYRLDDFFVEIRVNRLTAKPEAIYSVPNCRVAKLYGKGV